ncbi:MAG: hypothetical protein K5639_05280 [Eubacterium sp.]|nr:hypothetical protein [Eubacterium sp.]
MKENDIKSRTKMIAYVAVMTALGTVFLLLGTFIGINTVFFTALAAYLVGIVAVSYGTGASVMMYFGCAALDALLNPNKFHVFLFLGMAAFTLIAENSYRFIAKHIPERPILSIVHFLLRAGVFAAVYIPIVLFLPQLFLRADIIENNYYPLFVTLGGIVAFLVYDRAYIILKNIYMNTIGSKLRR